MYNLLCLPLLYHFQYADGLHLSECFHLKNFYCCSLIVANIVIGTTSGVPLLLGLLALLVVIGYFYMRLRRKLKLNRLRSNLGLRYGELHE